MIQMPGSELQIFSVCGKDCVSDIKYSSISSSVTTFFNFLVLFVFATESRGTGAMLKVISK